MRGMPRSMAGLTWRRGGRTGWSERGVRKAERRREGRELWKEEMNRMVFMVDWARGGVEGGDEETGRYGRGTAAVGGTRLVQHVKSGGRR